MCGAISWFRRPTSPVSWPDDLGVNGTRGRCRAFWIDFEEGQAVRVPDPDVDPAAAVRAAGELGALYKGDPRAAIRL